MAELKRTDIDEYKILLRKLFNNCDCEQDSYTCWNCSSAVDKAIECMEELYEYRWHDLTKDPNDLPEYGDEIVCEYEVYGFRAYSCDKYKSDCFTDDEIKYYRWRLIS